MQRSNPPPNHTHTQTKARVRSAIVSTVGTGSAAHDQGHQTKDPAHDISDFGESMVAATYAAYPSPSAVS